jgi:hypothetical protein
LVAGTDLDGIISNAPPKQRKAYVAAAILAFQKENGLEIQTAPVKTAPGLDLALMSEVQHLLEQMVGIGLTHLSLSFLQRIQQLSVRCRTGGFVRPGLELESCVKEIDWVIHRHARGDTRRLFNKMARLYALTESIQNQGEHASFEFIGSARSKYERVRSLDLTGMGAYPWETESGFVGLTALFWSPDQKQFFSWSDSRPKHATGGFTPSQRLEGESPWPGGGLLVNMCHSTFTLENPGINPNRRLSAYQGCRVSDTSPFLDLKHLPPFHTDWQGLRKSLTEKRLIGLRRGSPLDHLCMISPKKWHKPRFDEIRQNLVVPLEDSNKEMLMMELPFTEMTAAAVYFLESYNGGKSRASILGYFRMKPYETMLPVSLIEDKNGPFVFNLLFVPLPKKKFTWRGILMEKIRPYIPLPVSDGTEDTEFTDRENDISRFLSPVDDHLIQLAERGIHTKGHGIEIPRADLSGTGFLQMFKALKNITTPRDILVARYQYLLHLDALWV